MEEDQGRAWGNNQLAHTINRRQMEAGYEKRKCIGYRDSNCQPSHWWLALYVFFAWIGWNVVGITFYIHIIYMHSVLLQIKLTYLSLFTHWIIYQCFHFLVVETEVQRNLATYPRKHSWENMEFTSFQVSLFLIPEGNHSFMNGTWKVIVS